MMRQIWTGAVAVVIFSFFCADVGLAQREGQERGGQDRPGLGGGLQGGFQVDRGGPVVFGGMGGAFDNSLALLMREDVRSELVLDNDQFRELQELQRESRDVIREMFQRDGGRGGRVDFNEIQQRMQEFNQEFDQRIDRVLLPHQQQRLRQLQLQTRQQSGTHSALESIASELNISDQQLQELRAKAEEARRNFERRVAEAREQMEKEILSVLTPEQQRKYREMVGESFDFQRARDRRVRGRDGDGDDRGRGDDTRRRGDGPQRR